MYEVDKGVPIMRPIAERRNWRGLLVKLAVGDSFFVPEEDFAPSMKVSIISSVHQAGKAEGMKVATRTVEGGLRVWRFS